MLKHIRDTEAGRENYEAFQGDMFRVTVLFNPNSGIADEPLITEHCTNVSGWADSAKETVEQQQGARRLFDSNKIDTVKELTLAFTLNFNNNNELYIYEKFLEQHRLQSNELTFEKALKRNYVFTIIIEHFLRDETLVYKKTLFNSMLTGEFASGLFDGDITDSEPKQLEISVIGEYPDSES